MAVLAACNFDASGVAEAGGDESSGGVGSATTTMSATTSPTSTTMLDGSATVADSGETTTSSTTAPADSSSSGGEGDSGSSSSAEQGESSSSGGPEQCVEILWVSNVLDPTGTTDEALYDRLVRMGYAITFIGDDVATAADAEGYCALVLSAVADSSDIAGEFHDVAVPVVTWEFALFDDMGFAVTTSEYGLDEGATQIDIVDASHPLAAGLSGTVTIYEGTGRVSWAVAENAAVVAVRTDNAQHASLFAYEAGDALADGTIAASKRAGLPFSNALRGELQPAAIDIFAAAVDWATAP